jgi:glucan phosphoethanolaminetransferase (alkaline phosphatase superfamily)
MQKQSRPRGVSIIAILIIIAGVLSLLFGIGLVVIGPFLMNGVQTSSSNLGSQIGPQILGLVFLVFGGILLGLGVANLVMAYGLWKGKGWAWTISIIVLFIGIAISIASVSITSTGVFSNAGSNLLGDIVSGIVSIGISAFIVYYLYKPHVKAYFGKTIPMPST